MEIIIILLLVSIVTLVGFLIWLIKSSNSGRENIEAVVGDKLVSFSDNIRRTMEDARKEVSESKDIISKNALETLKHIGDMNKAIHNLSSQQEKAEKLGQSLEYLLQAPKLRGNYGEAVLEEMLERVLPRGIWQRQYSIDGSERVDAVVKYKEVVIPIDSKFPKDDYQKYLAARDAQEKKAHWADYERALKTQINSIKDKYVKPEKGTSEFALLFIPSESMYYETIAEKNYLGDPCQIYEYATDRKVIPVSPNTFYAFLNVVMLGIRNIEIAREAKKLQESLIKVERDFDRFYKKYDSIGKALDSAREAYRVGDDHVQRFKRNLESTLKLEKNFQMDAEKQPRLEE